MKKPFLQSLRVGFIFGIVHIFLVLIGFNSLVGTLLARISGAPLVQSLPPARFMVVYALLLALWAGFVAARQARAKTLGGSLAHGAAAGLASAALAFAFSLGLSWFLVHRVDFRQYLAVLSFDFIRVTLFNLAPLNGALAVAGTFLTGATLGGLLTGVFNLAIVRSGLQQAKGFLAALQQRFSSLTHGKYRLVFFILGLVLLAAAVILLPLKWGSYWNYVTGTVGLYVVLGLGLNIIVGLSGQLVLGYIAFFAIGAYTMALLNSPFPHNLMWGFWPALVLGVALAALAGVLLGLPLMRLRGDYLAIVTLGFGEIIRILLKSDILTNFTGGPRGIQNISGPTLFGRVFNSDVHFTYLITAAVLLAAFVYHRLQYSRTGRAWLSIREDETVARATGVNTKRYKLLALALGAAFAGLAGAIFASRNQFTGPEEHSLMASINVLSLIIVGGMGNIPGTILGAFALKGLPEILREFANYRLLTFGALLVVMMLSRPNGMIPSKRPKYRIPPESAEEHPQEARHDG
jgi:branched-chain amino acid transport system permease protein